MSVALTAQSLSEDGLARSFLDALPMAAVVVDEGQRVVVANPAALLLFQATDAEVLGRRAGDALRCVTTQTEASKGCGFEHDCRSCLLRKAGVRAIQGERTRQEEVELEVMENGRKASKYLLVTASPLTTDARLALVLMQDITEFHRLRGLIPICAGCKRIRKDDVAWQAVESFIERHSHAQFSHALCPDCVKRLYHDGAE